MSNIPVRGSSKGGLSEKAGAMSHVVKKVKGNLERLFDKNLADLIRGIRNNKENEAKFIAQCMEEIKQELKQENINVKTNAVAKLAYLQMLGYDISWASFNIIEVMASTRFTDKRVGYLTASQCFHDQTDVLMLTTNMIRKDLNSASMYEAGTALGSLSCFITTDLARDLANDIVTLLTSSRPYVRKRAVLLLYKIFLKYPDALRPTFPRLKEKLEDPDPGVQSAAVNVICELARKNPKNYLSLAPVFFKLMTTSSNNWMLIKIIKLFGALVSLEPRLGKKLLEPLTNLINSTSAMSLLYECINTVIAGHPGDHTTSIQLCVQKLGILIEDTDQNLKYLGLLAMGKILKTHPKAVQAHKDVVLSCLDDKDESIRLRALDLIYGMVSKKNIMEIVKKLMEHVEAAEGSMYRDELLSRIIQICAHNNYQYITNFEWYVSVLVELTKVEGTKHGILIAQQMQDVAVRVHSIRHFAVSQMALLIENAQLLLAGSAQQRSNISEVLLAAAWICGEYSEHLRNPQAALESMVRTKVGLMPGHIQSTFVQNIGKLYAVLLEEGEKEDDWDKVWSLDNLMLSKLPQFEQTDHLEAQERACSLLELMKEIDTMHKGQQKMAESVAILFNGELNPVAPKAQRKVPVPEGLDLEAWINEPPPESSETESEEEEEEAPKTQNTSTFGFGNDPQFGNTEPPEPKKTHEPTPQEAKKMREARKAELDSNPHYLKSSPSGGKLSRPQKLKTGTSAASSMDGGASLPEVHPVDLQSPLEIPGMVGLDKYLQQQQQTLSWKKAKKVKKTKGKKGKKGRVRGPSSSEEELPVVHVVNRGGEMPDGAKSTDSESDMPVSGRKEDPFKALDVDLDKPLEEDERLFVPHHRVVSPEFDQPPTTGDKKKKKKKGKEIEEPVVEEPKKKKKAVKEKKEKKEKKSKKTADLLNGTSEVTQTAQTSSNQDQGASSAKGAPDTDDLEFWLSGTPSEAPGTSAPQVVAQENGAEDGKKKKMKKSKSKESTEVVTKRKLKKEKSKDSSRRKSQSEDQMMETEGSRDRLARDRSDYEVASGVCTPSKQLNSNSETPNRPAPSPLPPTAHLKHHPSVHFPLHHHSTTVLNLYEFQEMSSFKLLAENQHLRLSFETRVSTSDANQIAAAVVFSSKTNQGEWLRNLEFNVVDSLNTKFIRDPAEGENNGPDYMSGAQGGVKVPFTLPPALANEHQFRFSVQSINVPQKLRGTLTYMFEDPEGAVPEKLDFHLRFPCIAFTLPATISREAFAEMLSGGDLKSKSSIKFDVPNETIQTVLQRICYLAHFSVVEQMEGKASLYSQTIQADPICLLLRLQGTELNLDGKCGDGQLLSYILQEIRDLFTNETNGKA